MVAQKDSGHANRECRKRAAQVARFFVGAKGVSLNFLYGFFIGILVREVIAWLPRLSLWLVNRGLRKVPAAVREQRREEWISGA